MNIIEIIKRNIRKNSKIKLLNESIDKNKMIELFSRIQDLIGIADIDQNIQYINKGEYKTLKEVFNYQGNEIIYKDMIKLAKLYNKILYVCGSLAAFGF